MFTIIAMPLSTYQTDDKFSIFNKKKRKNMVHQMRKEQKFKKNANTHTHAFTQTVSNTNTDIKINI